MVFCKDETVQLCKGTSDLGAVCSLILVTSVFHLVNVSKSYR